MTEEWKEIEDYPGYWISSFGRVWSNKSNKFLSPGYRKKSKHKNASSYYVVTLRINGVSHTKQVHRLVASAFLDKPEGVNTVRHLDGNPYNNNVANLAWGSDADNAQDAIRHGTFHYVTDEERKKGRDVIRTPILVRNRKTNQKILYESLTAAAEACSRSLPSMCEILHRKGKLNKRSRFSAEYVLWSDKIMSHINTFPEYSCEIEWRTLPDGTRKREVKNMFRGVNLGLGGYIVGNPGIYENVVMLDVQSMHPSSMIALNLFGEYTDRFKQLVDARLAIKHKDFDKARTMLDGKLAPYLDDPSEAKALANALKLAINSTYGMTYQDYQGNPFHDSRNVNNIVALRGAIFMKMLQDEMEARGVTVAAIRTDSIKLVSPSQEDIDFAMEFAKKYSYSFEFECVYDRMCLTTKSDYIAKYMSPEECEKRYGWTPDENKEHGGEWTSTAAFFSKPYIFKTLFSHEPIEFEDLCEVKEVQRGAMYLDMNEGLEDDEHNYIFIGRVESFCPISSGHGGGILVVKRDDKYNAVNGSTGYRWLQSEQIKLMNREDDIDMTYYHALADEAIAAINNFGDFEWFARD